MTALHQYISAVGSFQGVLLFFLLVCDRTTSTASKVLGLYCLCMGLAFFLPFIALGVTAELFKPLAAWLFFVPVMYGPLLYLYCSKVVFNAPFKLIDTIHLIPLLICYLLNIDSLFIHHEAFRLWIFGSPAPTARLSFSEYILFSVAIGYLLATIGLIRRYYLRAFNTLSNFNPDVFRWLGLMISSFIVIFTIKGIMAFSDFATPVMLVVSDALIVMVILVIALTQWKKPRFFEISHHSNVDEGSRRAAAPPSPTGTLEPSTRAAMFETLTKHIEQEHSYRDSELSLTTLAEACGLSPHHLSEVLNQHAGKNFNQFINEYRVNEVCERLNTTDTTPVLDIAIQAGFSSKSTFNTLFKKIVGLTPTQYRKQRQAP